MQIASNDTSTITFTPDDISPRTAQLNDDYYLIIKMGLQRQKDLRWVNNGGIKRIITNCRRIPRKRSAHSSGHFNLENGAKHANKQRYTRYNRTPTTP